MGIKRLHIHVMSRAGGPAPQPSLSLDWGIDLNSSGCWRGGAEWRLLAVDDVTARIVSMLDCQDGERSVERHWACPERPFRFFLSFQ